MELKRKIRGQISMIDLTGQTFGRLTVESCAGKLKGLSYYWNCICVCGNIKAIKSNSLRSGVTVSCGCYAKEEQSKSNRKEAGYSAITRLISEYKYGAKSRGFEWDLSRDNCEIIFNSNCYYCGVEPSNTFKGDWGKQYYKAKPYNGIDRMDNKKGYILENVVPCCKICNRAKHTMDFDDFINWINRIKINK